MQLTMLILASLVVVGSVAAKDKKSKAPKKEPQDEISVVGHVQLPNASVKGFMPTDHYSSHYLYVEYTGGKNLTLIDVTKAERPAILAEVAAPSAGDSAGLFAVAGTAALVTDGRGAAVPVSSPQTMRIMDLSDPQHPKVAREFTGVTAITRDDRRGLIFLANGEGLWILHQSLAIDPEVEKAYAHHVVYDN